MYIKGLDDLERNLAKVEVGSSSLLSRSMTSLVVVERHPLRSAGRAASEEDVPANIVGLNF
jgi:hypothetical protein